MLTCSFIPFPPLLFPFILATIFLSILAIFPRAKPRYKRTTITIRKYDYCNQHAWYDVPSFIYFLNLILLSFEGRWVIDRWGDTPLKQGFRVMLTLHLTALLLWSLGLFSLISPRPPSASPQGSPEVIASHDAPTWKHCFRRAIVRTMRWDSVFLFRCFRPLLVPIRGFPFNLLKMTSIVVSITSLPNVSLFQPAAGLFWK